VGEEREGGWEKREMEIKLGKREREGGRRWEKGGRSVFIENI
jgi:hypothetical protein